MTIFEIFSNRGIEIEILHIWSGQLNGPSGIHIGTTLSSFGRHSNWNRSQEESKKPFRSVGNRSKISETLKQPHGWH